MRPITHYFTSTRPTTRLLQPQPSPPPVPIRGPTSWEAPPSTPSPIHSPFHAYDVTQHLLDSPTTPIQTSPPIFSNLLHLTPTSPPAPLVSSAVSQSVFSHTNASSRPPPQHFDPAAHPFLPIPTNLFASSPSSPTTILDPNAAPYVPLPLTIAAPLAIPTISVSDQWRTLFNYSHDYRLHYHQQTRKTAKLSKTNLRHNLPWGDVLGLKGPNVFRLYCQNINGLKLDAKGGELNDISDVLLQLECDLVGFSELNLDVSKYNVKSILYDTLDKKFDCQHFAASTSQIPFEGYYKPGGTFTGCFNHINTRFNSKFDDPMGRWSTISLTGKKGKIIHFITVYQLVSKAVAGPFTAYQQQASSLQLASRVSTPRKAFLQDLIKYMKEISNDSSEFVVMGDLNEVVGLDSSGFAQVTRAFDLVDIMLHYHSFENEVPTYSRGKTRLDYVFCTPNLLSAVDACGIEPFNQHIFSDHRAIFVDWNEKELFGSNTQPMAHHTMRKLQTTNALSRINYIKSLDLYCIEHQVFKRIQAILDGTTPSEKELESLDRDISRGMAHGENKCRVLGSDPWSPKLKKARLKVEIYRHAVSMAKTGIDLRTKLSKLLAVYTDLLDIPDDLVIVKKFLRQAQDERDAILKDAAEHRRLFLEEQREKAEALEDVIGVERWTKLMQADEIKKMYKKLRFIRNDGAKHSGLTTLEVPTDPNADPKQCKQWTTVDAPDEITKYLLARNRKHFGQAHGTPFTVPPLNLHVDFTASTEECEFILDGDYDTAELDDLTALLVQYLEKQTPLDTLPFAITEKEMMDKFHKWPERTSTSPSGRHLGHYRCLLERSIPPELSKKAAGLDDQRKRLIWMHNSMINNALKYGHSYRRWQKVVNVMLEKEPGNPKIHRLRVIHLYEADYNLILALKWRSLIHHAEDNFLLHNSLYGARPGRGSLDPVFIEEAVNELSRLTRYDVAKLAEDATACYDRIIPGVGNLASRSHGLHRSVAIVQGKTLTDVRYHLKTQLGVSDENYHHCEIFPIYGTGQGSGNSPTVWLVISSILFKCYSARAHGATFATPDRQLSLELYRVGFVDDTCSYVNHFSTSFLPNPETILDMLRHDAQLWSDLLFRSGGGLELPKCLYHYSRYNFSPTGKPLLQHGRIGSPVFVTSGDGLRREQIECRTVLKAHKTLGCYKSPSGAQSTQHRILQEKCDKHARIVSTSALTRKEAWTYYMSMYLTSPGYALPVCHFSIKELQTLEKRSLPALISKCGFNRKTCRKVLCGPNSLNGGGFRPFETEQGVGQLQFFVKYWTQQCDQGKLLRMMVAWSQVNVGVDYSIFTDTTSPLPHWDSKYLKSIRLFLSTIGGRLRLDTTFIPPIQRVNDTHIMSHVLSSGKYQTPQIIQINYCQLYLDLITVSDMTNAAGDRIIEGIREGHRTVWASTTKYHPTNQGRPDSTSWTLWRRFIMSISVDLQLLVPLQHWIVPLADQRQSWPAYHDPVTDTLLLHKDGIYERHRRNCATYDYDFFGFASVLPNSCTPVDLHEDEFGWLILASSRHYPSLPRSPPDSFATYCSLLDDWEANLLATVTLHFPPFELIDLLTGGDFSACSDGSAVFKEGTYGWVLSTSSGTRLAYGAGPVDGHDPRSFRSEGQGMLSLTCFLRRLREWTQNDAILSGLLATDNSGLVDRVNEQTKIRYPVPNTTFMPDWDVVEAIVRTITDANLLVTVEHVKGHQDDDNDVDELSLIAKLNIEADKHAGDYRISYGQYLPVIPLSPTRPVALDIGGKTIHRGFKSAIRAAAHEIPLLQTMTARYNWGDHVIDTIDWVAHSRATNSKERRTHLVKLCHGWLPVGKLVSKYGGSFLSSCSLCQTEDEDHKHVLRCVHITREKWRNQLLKSLGDSCSRLNTDPILTSILINGISCWLSSCPFDSTGIPRKYRRLLLQQHEIGWYHLFLGRFSKEWSRLQQAHLTTLPNIPKGQSGDRWVSVIAKKILTNWYTLWDTRNKDRHGHDLESQKKEKRKQAIRELEKVYTLRHLVLQRHRSIFYDDIEKHKAAHTRTIFDNG